jgi:cbb3-type cytochrome oxidase maturation protein
MGMIYILIPLSLALVGVAVWAFIWAVNSGQFDDLDTPGWDMLSDDDTTRSTSIVDTDVCLTGDLPVRTHA